MSERHGAALFFFFQCIGRWRWRSCEEKRLVVHRWKRRRMGELNPGRDSAIRDSEVEHSRAWIGPRGQLHGSSQDRSVFDGTAAPLPLRCLGYSIRLAGEN